MPVSGGWAALPTPLLDQLLALLGLDDLRSCALVCRSWWRRLADEQALVWRVHCFSRLSADALRSEVLAVLPGYRAKLKALLHGWNPQDCSRNMYVKLDGLTVHRNPVAQSTDGARGRRGFICGRHAWQVVWEGPLGTVAVVGVATRAANLQCHGYLPLLGADSSSWGWNLVDNKLLHDGHTLDNYPQLNNAPKYQVGEKIRVVLDCDGRTLSFERDCEFLGVAFRGLPKDEPVFPAISAVYGHTEVSMVYVGAPLDG